MKKIMILLLALAVLFGFAACDNSGDTPVDPDQPDTPATGLSERYIGYYSDIIEAMLDGEKLESLSSTVKLEDVDYTTVGITTLLAANTNILEIASKNYAVKEDYTLGSGYTTVSQTETIDTKMPGLGSDTVVTLTLTGIDTTPDVTKDGTKTIQFETYTYEFTTPVYDTTGHATTLSGTISGYLTGYTMDVVLANSIATSATLKRASSPAATIILPEGENGVDVVLGTEEVTPATLLNFMNATGIEDAKSYSTYRNGLIGKKDNSDGFRKDINAYVQTLIGSANSIFAVLDDDVNAQTKPDGMTVSFSGDTTKGTATITYEVPSTDTAAVTVSGAASGAELRLAPGDKLEIVLNSKANTNSTTGFAVDTFTITGTFQAYTSNAAEKKFSEIYDVTINGKVSAGDLKVVGTNGNTFGSLTVGDGTGEPASVVPDLAITTGSATADIAVGPAIRTDEGHLGEYVVEPVTVEYKD